MRISILPTNASPLVLGDDDARLWISQYLPRFELAVQISPLFRAINAKVFQRSNATWTIAFQVDRTFDDLASAQAFVLDYPATIPTQGTIEILQSHRRRYFKNAALREFRVVSFIGVSLQLAYAFSAESTSTNL
jgi:DNA-binding XRE family transcriptional regulator